MTFKQITPRKNNSLADMITTKDLSKFIPQTVDTGSRCKNKKVRKKKSKK